MAAAANGIMQIDSDGNINFNEEGFIEAMSFYRELIDEGLACPMEVEKDEDGDYNDVAVYYSTQDMADQKFVIGRIEAWQAVWQTASVSGALPCGHGAATLPVMATTPH